jgi:hypothetical protein
LINHFNLEVLQMAEYLTSTNAKVYLSLGEPATVDAAGFAAKTYTEVKGVTTIPTFGATTEVVPINPLADGFTSKSKGFTNYGSQSFEAGFIEGDAGQALVEQGADGVNKFSNHSMKIEYSNGAVRYYVCQIFGYNETVGAANSTIMLGFNVEINSPIVRVVAP